MANPQKGEVAFEVDGKTWTLRYSANALAELEDALDLPIGKIIEALQGVAGVRIKTIRAVVHAGLTDRHPGISVAEAGELMTALGIAEMTAKIGEAFSAAFPQVDGDASAGPRTGAEAGTGASS